MGQASFLPSQFSSMLLPHISLAPRYVLKLLSLQSRLFAIYPGGWESANVVFAGFHCKETELLLASETFKPVGSMVVPTENCIINPSNAS